MANAPLDPISGPQTMQRRQPPPIPPLHRGPLPGILSSPAARPRAAGNSAISSALHAPEASAAVPPADPYDFTADPILRKIEALSQQARQNATANALAARKQLAIAYGDTAGILEGDQFDQATADAAKNNPFSILAELQRGYQANTHNIDESENAANLFYSGDRVHKLGLAAEDLQRQRAQAASALQGKLGDIQSSLAAALMGADQQDISGLADAASRAQQRATTYGFDPGAAPAAAAAPSHAPAPAGNLTRNPGLSTLLQQIRPPAPAPRQRILPPNFF